MSWYPTRTRSLTRHSRRSRECAATSRSPLPLPPPAPRDPAVTRRRAKCGLSELSLVDWNDRIQPPPAPRDPARGPHRDGTVGPGGAGDDGPQGLRPARPGRSQPSPTQRHTPPPARRLVTCGRGPGPGPPPCLLGHLPGDSSFIERSRLPVARWPAKCGLRELSLLIGTINHSRGPGPCPPPCLLARRAARL